uniref:Uncharacterized protein n=2 Tax=Methanosarcinales TaxID=94695 RepID=A0A7G9YN64_9EURY|nr:hypothetical protein OCBBGKCP_00005 [Methanosarcinales archaeon ANME-2c ERB4]QNT35662.1 hypothetical protein GNCGGNMO_00024 [uncultured Methanosarcinales archaeon]
MWQHAPDDGFKYAIITYYILTTDEVNMEAKLRRADIVLIASAHNPSIMAPQWLKDESLILEEPSHFVHTPDLAIFESESFSLVVDHHRLQIAVKKQDTGSLESLANIVSNYVKLLPHIPYKALGLNFVWTIEVDDGEELPKIELNINKNDLMSIFGGTEVSCGGIIYTRKESYMLKVVIEPQGGGTLVHNFNYNYELEDMSVGGIVKLIDNFLTMKEDSSSIVKGLYRVGEQ